MLIESYMSLASALYCAYHKYSVDDAILLSQFKILTLKYCFMVSFFCLFASNPYLPSGNSCGKHITSLLVSECMPSGFFPSPGAILSKKSGSLVISLGWRQESRGRPAKLALVFN